MFWPRKAFWAWSAGILFLAYFGLYAACISNMEPANNMAYFVYPGPENGRYELLQYYGFYPLYLILSQP